MLHHDDPVGDLGVLRALGDHEEIRTGTDDQKLRQPVSDGYAQRAIARTLGRPQHELACLQCRLGSRVTDIK
ncbi:hypothetical protein [Streptomyces europaeiscabiei]|uniref:hypothetical protein n=1 Tax=Streptomyces europaeiscabiei TaxID=146819 RepID=UPI002E157E2B|nr:hypothetical protein OHB30_03645 [Streptomyces europaeiscabiei]